MVVAMDALDLHLLAIVRPFEEVSGGIIIPLPDLLSFEVEEDTVVVGLVVEVESVVVEPVVVAGLVVAVVVEVGLGAIESVFPTSIAL